MTFTHDFSRRMGTHDLLAQDNTQTQWAQRGAHTRSAMQQEAVRGVPANIVVHRIRTDVIWKDVVSSAGHPIRQYHNGLPPPLPSPSLSFLSFIPLYLSSSLVCINTTYRVVPEDQ